MDSMESMIAKLMSDPAVGELVNRLKDSAATEPSEQTDSADSTEMPVAAAAPDIGIPPDMLSKLPEIMGAIGPLSGGRVPKTWNGMNNMACLLGALKPYLSPARCSAVDNIIAISKLSSVAGFLPDMLGGKRDV